MIHRADGKRRIAVLKGASCTVAIMLVAACGSTEVSDSTHTVDVKRAGEEGTASPAGQGIEGAQAPPAEPKKGTLTEVSPGLESLGPKVPPILEEPQDLELLAETDNSGDGSEANGSSIALMLEYKGKRVILSGDAFSDDLVAAIESLGHDEQLAVDAFKLPHHGSKKNVTPQLMASIECPTYLISTSGSRFHHPDVDAIKIIIDGHKGDAKPEFLFNYRSDDNEFWENQSSCTALYEDDALLAYEIAD